MRPTEGARTQKSDELSQNDMKLYFNDYSATDFYYRTTRRGGRGGGEQGSDGRDDQDGDPVHPANQTGRPPTADQRMQLVRF